MDEAAHARENLPMARADPLKSASLLAGRTILQVVPALDAGGVERTTVDVAVAAGRAGARSMVVSAGGRLEAELREGGVESHHLPLDSRSPLAVASGALALRRLIRAERVDLVHARSRLPAWAARWALRGTGAAFVTTYAGIHNAGWFLKRAYNGVMAKGDEVIANSAFTRDHLIAEHGTDPARVVAIPRGLDLDRFDPAAVSAQRIALTRLAFGRTDDDRRPWFLLAGRLTRWKGQTLAIEALARAQGAAAEAVLVLAGDEQDRAGYREELRALAHRLGLSGRVRIVGHLADMPAAYLAGDIAIAPSLDPEAFGRTAAEPQAMGRPVLAADHGGARETVETGVAGLLVAPGNVSAWAGALDTAASWTVAERAAMGARGQARVRALFSVEAMTAATLALYARLLAGRRDA